MPLGLSAAHPDCGLTRLLVVGRPLGGPLRGSWQAATRLLAGRYAACGGPLRGSSSQAATRHHVVATSWCRYAAQVWRTRPKPFYETQPGGLALPDRTRHLLRVRVRVRGRSRGRTDTESNPDRTGQHLRVRPNPNPHPNPHHHPSPNPNLRVPPSALSRREQSWSGSGLGLWLGRMARMA